MRFIPVDHLTGQEILAVNIINSSMQILVREGALLSNTIVKRIKKYGIHSVYIIDDRMKSFISGDIKATIEPIIRNKSVFKIKNAFEKFEDKVRHQKKSLQFGETGELLFNEVRTISKDLIQEVMISKDHTITMNDIKSISNYHFEHAVNVAVLSLIIGAELGLSSKDLEALTFGALLIDVGSRWVGDELLLKKEILTEIEKQIVAKHVDYGYSYIKNNTTFNAHVKSIIMHHHERMNGTGYPKGLVEKEIHPLAKIIMIADVYDALTSDRPYRKAFCQHEAIEFIMGNAGSLFDFKLSNIFARKVIPYPVGSYVLLSNNQKGVVITNNKDHPLRPIVRTFGVSSYTNTNSVQIDLLEVNNVVIEKIIYTLH
jgi:HD-GYP domain-containing protein (c-di-GMP phosphodiesterase class II)